MGNTISTELVGELSVHVLSLESNQTKIDNTQLLTLKTDFTRWVIAELLQRDNPEIGIRELMDNGMSHTGIVAGPINLLNEGVAPHTGYSPFELKLDVPNKASTLSAVVLHRTFNEAPPRQSEQAVVTVKPVLNGLEQLAIDPKRTSEWMPLGSCRAYGPNIMCPKDRAGVDKARRICAGCCVKSTCLEYALENKIEHGIWGGASERERKRELKRRRQPKLQSGRV